MAQVVEERPNNISYLYEYGKLLIELDQYDQAYAWASGSST